MKYWLTDEFRRLSRLYYKVNYKSLNNPQRTKPVECLACKTPFTVESEYYHSGSCKKCRTKQMRIKWNLNKRKYNAQRRERYRKEKQ